MVDTAEVSRGIRRLIGQSRRAAEDRRVSAELATRDGGRVLATVVAPVFKKVASVLKAEGYVFQVSTPAGAVRMAAGASNESFIELVLDTGSDPPALCGRTSRTRGRRVLVEERVVRDGDGIGKLTDDDVLRFLLDELGPYLS